MTYGNPASLPKRALTLERAHTSRGEAAEVFVRRNGILDQSSTLLDGACSSADSLKRCVQPSSCRREVSFTPHMLGIYAVTATKVHSELTKRSWLTFTSDGWSRQQLLLHITNYQAAVPGVSCFTDFTDASTEQVTGESSCHAGISCGSHHACLLKTAALVTAVCLVSEPKVKPLCLPAARYVADTILKVLQSHRLDKKTTAVWDLLKAAMPLWLPARVWSIA